MFVLPMQNGGFHAMKTTKIKGVLLMIFILKTVSLMLEANSQVKGVLKVGDRVLHPLFELDRESCTYGSSCSLKGETCCGGGGTTADKEKGGNKMKLAACYSSSTAGL